MVSHFIWIILVFPLSSQHYYLISVQSAKAAVSVKQMPGIRCVFSPSPFSALAKHIPGMFKEKEPRRRACAAECACACVNERFYVLVTAAEYYVRIYLSYDFTSTSLNSALRSLLHHLFIYFSFSLSVFQIPLRLFCPFKTSENDGEDGELMKA